jgi:hypothetical protein
VSLPDSDHGRRVGEVDDGTRMAPVLEQRVPPLRRRPGVVGAGREPLRLSRRTPARLRSDRSRCAPSELRPTLGVPSAKQVRREPPLVRRQQLRISAQASRHNHYRTRISRPSLTASGVHQ